MHTSTQVNSYMWQTFVLFNLNWNLKKNIISINYDQLSHVRWFTSLSLLIMYEHCSHQLILYFIRGAKVDFSGSLRSVTNMSSNYWQLEISKTIFYFNAERLMKHDNFSEISRLTVKWSNLIPWSACHHPLTTFSSGREGCLGCSDKLYHYLSTLYLKRILFFLLLLKFSK